MINSKTIRIAVTAVILTVITALYGSWLITEAPSYWETLLFVTLLFLLYAVAVIRFVPYLITYFVSGKDPHLERIGDRTYRRCGMREIVKIVLLILVFRLLQLLLTYFIHLGLFGYTDTFFRIQRIWLDFYHVQYCFPAYPLLSNVFWFVSFNFNHARFLASYLFTALGGAMLYYWVLCDHDRQVARRTVLYFFLMPAGCLLMGTLPDGLFMMFSMLSLMFARKHRFIFANLFAMLSVTTHILGAVLFVPCLIEFLQMLSSDMRFHQEEKHGYFLRQSISAVSFLLIPLGFMFVLIYSNVLYGSSTALFRNVMDAYGYSATSPFKSAAALCDRFLMAMHTRTGEILYYELGNTIPNLVYLLLGAVVLVIAIGRIRTSYLTYMFFVYAVVLCTGTLLEIPRLLSLCAPFVLVLPVVIKNKWIHYGLYIACFAAFILYLFAVVGGYTIYGI